MEQIQRSDMNPHIPIHLNINQAAQKLQWRQPFQQMLLGKLDICIHKTETRPMSFTLYKYQFSVN
jgi:hypothetical protein